MLGDRLIFEKNHALKANKIYNYLINNYKKLDNFIICIAGISGVGKSEISQLLQEKLVNKNIYTYLLSLDDYYISNWEERELIRKETGIIGYKELYWDKINQIIKNFKKNKRDIYTQRLNRFTNSLEHTRINGQKINVIIVEGLYALYLKNKDFGVYLDAKINDTLKFRKKRKKENPDNDFRKKVLKIEEKDIKKSKKYADIIISYKDK